jgi:hypothetical protein
MKNYILLIFICATTFNSYSQSTGQIGAVNSQDFFQNADNYFVRDRSLATLDAIGSPFINEQLKRLNSNVLVIVFIMCDLTLTLVILRFKQQMVS